MRQNLLLTANDLKIGDTIIIPGAEKEQAKPVVAPKKTYAAVSTYKAPVTTARAQSEYVNTSGQYNLVWRSPYSGVWGNCTWYVASYKGVNWRGNANQWMRNAKAAGNATGSNPTIGAIVQFE
jgi:surface antigen